MALDIALLKTPNEISFSGNPIPFGLAVFPYTSAELVQDIRVIISIQVEAFFSSNLWQEVKKQTLYPGKDGIVTIDIQTVIDPYLQYYVPKPSLVNPVQAKDQARRFKITYQLTRNNAVVVPASDSVVFTAIKGGMAYNEWHPSEFFSNYLFTQKNFLSFTAKGEKIGLDEPHFLYFVAPQTDFFGVVFSVTDQDGIVHQFTLTEGVQIDKFGVGCIAAGYNQNEVLRNSGITYCVSYTVNILNAASATIYTKKYVIDHRNFYNTYQLLYRNSAGGLDGVRLRGQVDFEADYNRQAAQQMVPPVYFQNLSVKAQQLDSAEEQPKYKGDTGFISEAAADKLRDLFLAPQKWEVKDGKLLPVSLITKNTKFFSNKDNLISTQIEWQTAFVNSFYTPAGLMPIFRSCPPVASLKVNQVSKDKLQIMWALQSPYDNIEVKIIIAGNTYTFIYTGNYGSVLQLFTNPATNTPIPVQVQARTVCDANVVPIDYGPVMVVNLNVIGNSLPVAADDHYDISSGTGPHAITRSVLANDYDPDGDPIEAVINTTQTAAGGLAEMLVDGKWNYMPPSANFTGPDYFDYQVREVGATTAVTARVFINVGASLGVVYAKIVYRNTYSSQNGNITNTYCEVWIDFFSNAIGTQPVDVSGMNITFNVKDLKRNTNFNGAVTETIDTFSVPGTGTKMKIFDGLFKLHIYLQAGNQHAYGENFWSLTPGIGYTAI